MRIIREADGGIYTHKKKFASCIQAIDGSERRTLYYGERYFGIGVDDWVSQFFDYLVTYDEISVASFIARARVKECLSEEDIRMMACDMREEGLH
tara:strand:- start:344 stop:628 length:285 start_codon:yes stop_codon:yes gene_type:complete